jgi:hypothetical protein
MRRANLRQIISLDSKGIPPYYKFRHIFCFIYCKSIIEIDKRELSDDDNGNYSLNAQPRKGPCPGFISRLPYNKREGER